MILQFLRSPGSKVLVSKSLAFDGMRIKFLESLTWIQPSWWVDVAGIDLVELASYVDHNVQLKAKAIGKLFQVLNAFLIG